MLRFAGTFVLILMLTVAAAGCNLVQEDESDAVAVVNGVEISREEFDQEVERNVEMYTSQGYELTDEDMELVKEMALEQMISTELLLQQAEQKGITADEVDAEGEIEYIKSLFDSEEEFEQALAAQGFTEESYFELLKDSLIIHELLASQLDFDSIEVTEEEVQELFAMLEEEHGELDFAEMEPHLTAQLVEEKEGQLINTYIQQLRDEADIEILGY